METITILVVIAWVGIVAAAMYEPPMLETL
jgi:hypothetical protein